MYTKDGHTRKYSMYIHPIESQLTKTNINDQMQIVSHRNDEVEMVSSH